LDHSKKTIPQGFRFEEQEKILPFKEETGESSQ
jgi:hypothetical protein